MSAEATLLVAPAAAVQDGETRCGLSTKKRGKCVRGGAGQRRVKSVYVCVQVRRSSARAREGGGKRLRLLFGGRRSCCRGGQS